MYNSELFKRNVFIQIIIFTTIIVYIKNDQKKYFRYQYLFGTICHSGIIVIYAAFYVISFIFVNQELYLILRDRSKSRFVP